MRRTSLPRRDGQGRRRRRVAALAVVVCLVTACDAVVRTVDGDRRPVAATSSAEPAPSRVEPAPLTSEAARTPVDDADLPPPTDATFPPAEPSPPSGRPDGPVVAATFDLDVVGEASGLAVSVRNPGVVYVVDDGPGSTGVVAVDTATGRSTTVTVEGLDGRDTEALAVGTCDGRRARSCLFVGDIGNNLGAWERIHVWRVPEPALDGREQVTVTGRVAGYGYPGAPVDAEALLVEDGVPFIVTKESRDPETGLAPPPRLLGADAFADGTLRDLGEVPFPAPSRPLATLIFGNVATGGEAYDGTVVLRSYDHVLVYTPPAPDAGVASLPSWTPEEVTAPRLPQPEAVALDACGLWLTSEGVDSVWLVPDVPTGAAPHDEEEAQQCPTGDAPS